MKNSIYTLIGMSGVGKSIWSKTFEREGYTIYSIDELIALELESIIDNTTGDANVNYSDNQVSKLAKWMGFPGDERYEKNCEIYLKLESEITKKSVTEAVRSGCKSVIDTTGSVIYTDRVTQDILRENTTIIYLENSLENVDKMFEIFCSNPKPIIWAGIYKNFAEETENETLKRCYKELLGFRINKYEKLMQKKITFENNYASKTVEDFLKNLE